MSLYAKHAGNQKTPQMEPVPGRTDQVANNAGGFVFELDDWKRLDRFLVLGTEGGTFYVQEKPLTLDNCAAVQRCLDADGMKTLERIVEISVQGRNVRQGPVLFALALACKHENEAVRRAAYNSVGVVCRTATMLFEWVGNLKALGGVTSGAQRALKARYVDKRPDLVAYQMVKYQHRNGWSHRDTLRLGHVKPATPEQAALFGWAAGKAKAVPRLEDGTIDVSRMGNVEIDGPGTIFCNHPLVMAFEEAKTANEKRTIALIREHDLTHEMVASEHLKSPAVWEALLEKMPATALIRSLARMTTAELLKPMSKASQSVVAKLADGDWLKRSRVHPMAVLMANRTYARGAGFKGSLTWRPVPEIVAALDGAFDLTMANVEPANKRFLIGVDVSGSMEGAMAGPITAAEGAAAMSLVTLRCEPQCYVHGFANTFRDLGFTKRTSLEDALAKTRGMSFGSTDCALPMLEALKAKVEVDAFVVVTDSETWAGAIHPFQALKQYRQKMGIDAKLIVIGMTSTGFTIADPKDAGMLDVVGMDPQTPRAVSLFAAGKV